MHFETRTSVGLLFIGSLLMAACADNAAGPGQLPACAAAGTPIALSVAGYMSVDPATDSGCVTFAANTSTTDSAEYLVLPQSAGGNPGTSASFALQSATPAVVASLFASGITPSRSRGSAALTFDRMLRRLERNRNYATVGRAQTSPPIAQSPPAPGSLRTFKVCNNNTCSSFTTVGARAQSVGTHIAIYIDTLAPSPGLDATTLDALKQVFDTRLYDLDTTTFGGVSDIDNNSVVLVLMTNVVNKLVTKAQCTNSGYVAGFFFPADLDPSFAAQFNNGEIFYSIVADSLGTLSCSHKASEVASTTPVTFTHEFQHMINFVQHVLRNGGDSEDGWLDEGLSKYAEEIAGRSYLPDSQAAFSRYAIGSVYDAYQYLASPGTSPLLIPADTGTLAEVGASWLFVRYLVDQFGDSVAGKLVRTASIGTANVATHTGQPFATTVSRWGLANWVSDLPSFAAPAELQYKIWHFRATFSSLHSQDPADFPLAFPLVPVAAGGNAISVTGALWTGSGVYVRALQAPGGAAFTLRLRSSDGSAVNPAVVPRLNIVRIR